MLAAVIADMALDGSDEFIFVFGGDLCVAALAGHGDRHWLLVRWVPSLCPGPHHRGEADRC